MQANQGKTIVIAILAVLVLFSSFFLFSKYLTEEYIPEELTLGQPFILAVGESNVVGDYIISIDSLIQDNRCPIDVQCITAGKLIVEVSVTKDEVKLSGELSLHDDPLILHDLALQITAESPEPLSNVTLSEHETKVTLIAREATITSFVDCVAAGNPVMESYPRQCRHGELHFTEDIGDELNKSDLVQVTSVRPGSGVRSPFVLAGQARGPWYFEGDFPVKLLDENGVEIATAIAQAQSEWMTENFVDFYTTLEFEVERKQPGTLLLIKDNPSDLPELDDSFRVPVILIPNQSQ